MTAAELIAVLSWAPDWGPVEIQHDDTALASIERAFLTPRGAVVLVAKEEPQGQLGLF